MQVFKIAVLLLVCATHLSIAEETLTYSTQQRDNIYDFWITYKGKDLKDVVGNFRIFHTDDNSLLSGGNFTGKIVSGNYLGGKIEIQFEGDAPYMEVKKLKDRYWTIIPDKAVRNPTPTISVPMTFTRADQDYEASLTFEYYYAGGN